MRVLIAQSDPKSTSTLETIFWESGDKVWQTEDLESTLEMLDRVRPSLVVMDLHLPGDAFQEILARVREAFPRTEVLCTSAYPDPERETLARQGGARYFLTQPFTRYSVKKAIRDLSRSVTVPRPELSTAERTPMVRVPLRVKITLPYLLLALVLALAAAFIVSRVVVESVEDRFASELVAAGKQTAGWMVAEEGRLLETLRLVANTRGVPDAASTGDPTALRELIFSLVVNGQEDAVEILDTAGTSVLAIRREPGDEGGYVFDSGDGSYASWPFARRVLDGESDEAGDKFAGLAGAAWGPYFYVSGPIYDEGQELVGVVLVGSSLDGLVRRMREETLSNVSLYQVDGELLATSLNTQEGLAPPPVVEVTEVLQRQEEESPVRELELGEVAYSEILGPWKVRDGLELGLIGTALPQAFLFQTTQFTRLQVFGLVLAGLLLVIAIGVLVANRITNPLEQVVSASIEVARGNLEVKVETRGNDEISVLAHSFNAMITGLREGSIYRDLLGRTVSPEVREQLRQSLATGELYLAGQERVATVLMSDIRGFTPLTEDKDPTTVMDWLNEYFGELVPLINENGGVVNTFEGDSLMAFFGILPRPMPPEESAFRATQAALSMLRVVQRLNVLRELRGDPPLITGIVLNTGKVTAGSLGTADRLHYTVIGDTVNTTHRLQSVTRRFGESCVVLSRQTFEALGDRRAEFKTELLGSHSLRGKSESLQVYRLLDSANGGVFYRSTEVAG